MQIRPFELTDIPTVIRLRDRCFASSSQTTQQLAEARFRKVFFENPWYRKDISSLVAVNETGAIIGFLGVVPRPMKFRGELIWMAVKTQLMADPDKGQMAGIALLRSLFDGPQDLSYGDLVSDGSSKIGHALGQTVAGLRSLYWTRPIRPAQFALKKLRLRGFPSFAFKVLGAMAAPYLGRQRHSPFYIPPPDCRSKDIEAGRLCTLYEMLVRQHDVQAAYTQADLDWLLCDIQAELPGDRSLLVREVVDAGGRAIGWYICSFQKGGAAEILQFGGRNDTIERVIASASYDAYLDGATHLTGRVQPEYLSQLGHASIHFSWRGPSVGVHSKRSELRSSVLEGSAWLTKLEGEWWMNF